MADRMEGAGMRALSQVPENLPIQAPDVTSSDDWNAALFTPIKQPSNTSRPEGLLSASNSGGPQEEAKSVLRFNANGRPEETTSPDFGGGPEETFSPDFGGRPQELGVTPVREMEAFVESQVHALGPMRASIDSSDTEEEARKLGEEFVSDEGHAAAHARLAELLQAEKENALLRQHIESLKDKELDLALESGKEEVRRQAEMQEKYHQDMEAAAQEIERLRAQCSRLGGALKDKNADDAAREESERELLDLLAIVQENVQLSKQVHEEAGRAGYDGQLSPEDIQLSIDDAQLLPENVQLAGEASQDSLEPGSRHAAGKGQRVRPKSAGEASDVAWSKGTVVFTPALGRLDGDLTLPKGEPLVTASDGFVRGMHKGRSNGRMTARIRQLERQLAEAQAMLKASHPLPQAEPTEEMQELLLVVSQVERMERQIEELTKENQRLRAAATEPSPRSHLDFSVNSPISEQEADVNVPLLEWRTERALREEVGQLAELVLEMEARVSEAEAGEAQAKEDCESLREELQEWQERAASNKEELKQAQAQIEEQQLEVTGFEKSLLEKQQALESALESGEQNWQSIERETELRREEAEQQIAQQQEELMKAEESLAEIQRGKEALTMELHESRTLAQKQQGSLDAVQKAYADTQLTVERLETQLQEALRAVAESEAVIAQKDEALESAQDASNRLQRKLEILESELGVTHNLLEDSERVRQELEEGVETMGDVMLTSQLEAAFQEAEALRGQLAGALADLVGAQEREEMVMQQLERERKEGENLKEEIGQLKGKIAEGEAKMSAVLDELETEKERWRVMLEVAEREEAALQKQCMGLREEVLGLKDKLQIQSEMGEQERVVLEQGYAASERLAEAKFEELRSEIEELREKLADVEKRAVEVEREIGRCQETIGQLEAEVAEKGRSLAGAEDLIAGIGRECEASKIEEEMVKRERDGLLQQLRDVQGQLASTQKEAGSVSQKNEQLQEQLALNEEEKAALEGQLEIALLEVSVLQRTVSDVKRDLEESVLSLEASQAALTQEREEKENVDKALQSALEKLDAADKSTEVSELQRKLSLVAEKFQKAEEEVGRLEKELVYASERERELILHVAECKSALQESKEKEMQLTSQLGECEKALREAECERARLDTKLGQAAERKVEMTKLLDEKEESLLEAARCKEDLLRASERAILLSKQVGELEAALESAKQEARESAEKAARAESHVADVVRQLTEAQEQQTEMREALSEAELALNESEERAQVAEEEAGRASEELEKMRLEVEQARTKLSNEQQRTEDALEKARIEWQDDMERLLDATEQRYSQGLETALADAKSEWEKETEILVAETQREYCWEAEKEHAAFEEKAREVERLERELGIKREGLEDLRAEKEDLEVSMESSLKEVSALKEALEREKKQAELERAAAEEAEKEKRGLRGEIDRVSALLETAQDQNHKISNMVRALEKQLGDKQEHIEVLRCERRREWESLKEERADERDDLTRKQLEAKASHAMLQRQLDDALKLGEEALSGIEEKEKMLAEVKEQVNENESQFKELQVQLGEALSALESAKEEADLAESRAVQMEREMSELRKQRAEINAALAEACKEREEALQDQEEVRTELESVQNELESVQKKLDGVQEEFTAACTENEQLRKALTVSEEALVEMARAREEELEMTEREREKRAAKVRALESTIEALQADLKANEEKAKGLLAEKTAVERRLVERNEEVKEKLKQMEVSERGLREELVLRSEEAVLLKQTVAKLEHSLRDATEKLDAADLLREDLEAQIRALKDDVASLQEQNVAEEELAAVEEELKAMRNAWEAGKKVIEALKEQLAETECEVAETKRKLSDELSRKETDFEQELKRGVGMWVGVLTAWFYSSNSKVLFEEPKDAGLETRYNLTPAALSQGKTSEPIVEGSTQEEVSGDQKASSSESEVAAAKRLLLELRKQSERLHCELAGLAVDEPRQHDVSERAGAACVLEEDLPQRLRDLLKRLHYIHESLLKAQDRESDEAPAEVSTPRARQHDVTCGAIFEQVLALLKENTRLWAKVRMLPSLPPTLEALYAASLSDLETLVSQHKTLQQQLQEHVQSEQLNSGMDLLWGRSGLTEGSSQAEKLLKEERSEEQGLERESRLTENERGKRPETIEVELQSRGQEIGTWCESDSPVKESIFGLESAKLSEGRAWFNPVFAVEEECAQSGEDSKVADLRADRDKLLRQNGRLVIELESLKTRLVAAEDALHKARAESDRLSELDIAYGQLVKELERVWKEKEGLQQRVEEVRTADTLRTDDRTAENAGELGIRTPEKTGRALTNATGARSDKKRRLNFEEGKFERTKESTLEVSQEEKRAAQLLEKGGGGDSWGIRDVLERVLDENRRLQDSLSEQSTAVGRLTRQSRHDAKRAKRVEAECRTLTIRLYEQGLRLETILKENANISHRLGRKELAVAALQRHIKVLSKENRNVHDALKEREGRIKDLEQQIKRRK